MELTAYDLALVAGGIGIAGTLIGVLGTYWLAIKLAEAQAAHAEHQAEINALRDAKAKLRAAFAPALANIYLARHHGTHDTPVVSDILRESLLIHASAVEEFRPFVPASECTAYQEAWEEYRKMVRKGDTAIDTAEWGTEAERWSVIEKKIHVIFAFAKT